MVVECVWLDAQALRDAGSFLRYAKARAAAPVYSTLSVVFGVVSTTIACSMVRPLRCWVMSVRLMIVNLRSRLATTAIQPAPIRGLDYEPSYWALENELGPKPRRYTQLVKSVLRNSDGQG